jgi:hypothetical protein
MDQTGDNQKDQNQDNKYDALASPILQLSLIPFPNLHVYYFSAYSVHILSITAIDSL